MYSLMYCSVARVTENTVQFKSPPLNPAFSNDPYISRALSMYKYLFAKVEQHGEWARGRESERAMRESERARGWCERAREREGDAREWEAEMVRGRCERAGGRRERARQRENEDGPNCTPYLGLPGRRDLWAYNCTRCGNQSRLAISLCWRPHSDSLIWMTLLRPLLTRIRSTWHKFNKLLLAYQIR